MAREVPPAPSLDSTLLAEFNQALVDRHYGTKYQKAFHAWIARFLSAFPGRAIASLGEAELRAFLEDLAGQPQLTATARNQARSALLLLFHGVLGVKVDCTDGLAHTPVHSDGASSLSRIEVKGLLAAVAPAFSLMASLLYGSGLRPNELLLLRVRDIEVRSRTIRLRDQRDNRPERWALLPDGVIAALEDHLVSLRARHDADLLQQAGLASLPESVRQVAPALARAWEWQWLFPVARINWNPTTRTGYRPHQHESPLIRALQDAADVAGVKQRINAQTLRQTFKVHLVEAGAPGPLVEALLGVPTPAVPQLALEERLATRNLRSPLDLVAK
jgi:integrase